MMWRHLGIAFSLFAGMVLLDATAQIHALDVVIKVIVTREGMPWVLGTTNLPDGSILLVSVSRREAAYSVQRTAVVSNRRFTAGPFSQKGGPIPPGDYDVEVVLGTAKSQPSAVREVVGESNEKITGSLVRESSTGITARRLFRLNHGGAASPELDRRTREENEAARK